MKKLIMALALTSFSVLAESIRLPTYDQVAGVSNQVESVKDDTDIIRNLMTGSEQFSPYLAGIRFVFNNTEHSYVPEGDEYFKALVGAKLRIETYDKVYEYAIDDIHRGAIKRVYIPCRGTENVRVRFTPGQANHIYSSGEKMVHIYAQRTVDVDVGTVEPMDPEPGEEHLYRMIGRAQYYDPDNSHGKRGSGESFLITREFNSASGSWQTRFGKFKNNVWQSDCEIKNQIPQLDGLGGVANYDEIGNLEHAFETQAFPWNEAKRVAVTVDPAMLDLSGNANAATNVYYFTRVPIYVFKETIENLVISNFNASGALTSATTYPMQIRWVARPEITNGVDAAFYIPSWEKVYKRVKAGSEWNTVCIGVKEANLYACYKTAPTKTSTSSWALWRMAGGTKYVTQSFPHGTRDNSNYGVATHSRGTMHTYSTNLNAFAISMSYLTDGTKPGPVFRHYPAPTGDMATRRWSGNNWHDYQAFRELAYIQFGADAQNTTDGIKGINSTSVLESRQDDLEFYYAAQPNLNTFVIAPRTSTLSPFSWLGILNFWGSEGDQMADVTVVAGSDSDGTKSIFYLANLDHSLLIPNDSAGGTEFTKFTDTYGYERLDYNWAYTDQTGTYYRGKDQRFDYAAFNLVMPIPDATRNRFAVNLNSSAYDGVYAPSSYPDVPASGSSYSYWMCSLSNNRVSALGPWFVSANGGPSNANGNGWGGRASLTLLHAEGEARSGQ